jgi:hypothetical protein
MLHQRYFDAPGCVPVEKGGAFVQNSTAIIAYLPFKSKAYRQIRSTNDVFLSYFLYRKEDLASFWSSASAIEILGYETPEHNILYAWQDKCPCPEITNYIVKQVSNRSFVDRGKFVASAFGEALAVVQWRQPDSNEETIGYQ